MKAKLAVAAAFFLLVTLANACGGGGDEGDVDVVTTPEPTSPTASTPTSPGTGVASDQPATKTPLQESTPDSPRIASPTPGNSPEPTASKRSGDERLAPELTGISSWINSEPFTLSSQRGKVVLIDFWTYTCVNCIRTLPYLREWHKKYADSGLVIVGVHTPEFDFEKIRENVVEAVAKFEIEYPVAQDNDFGTWRAFENRFWPAKYMIDSQGFIRYTHFGEGAYAETEQQLRELLTEAGADLGDIPPNSDPEPQRDQSSFTTDVDMRTTRELYGGYKRNYSTLLSRTQPPYVRHVEFYEMPDAEVFYDDPGEHQNHFIYLNGLWRNAEESLVHARQTEGYEDYIAIRFYATSVNAVMAPQSGVSFKLRVTVDGEPITPEQAGDDVEFDEDGQSHVVVDEARMYRIVDQPGFAGHELRLSSDSAEFALFAFTFGDYAGGEPGGEPALKGN